MNTHVTERELADAVEADLAGYRLSEPETYADWHRREMAEKKQLIARHKRDLKLAKARAKDGRKSAREACAAELDRIAAEEAAAEEYTASAVAHATGLLTYHQTALDALPE